MTKFSWDENLGIWNCFGLCLLDGQGVQNRVGLCPHFCIYIGHIEMVLGTECWGKNSALGDIIVVSARDNTQREWEVGGEKTKTSLQGLWEGIYFSHIVITQLVDFSFAHGRRQFDAKPRILCVLYLMCVNFGCASVASGIKISNKNHVLSLWLGMKWMKFQ